MTSDGGDSVTIRGIVWNTTTSPTVSLTTKTNDGSGTGNFSSSITNLIPSSTYFVRAYATNSIGTAYGNELSFTTGAIVLPTLSTTIISGITYNSAVSGGSITTDGGGTITARGLVWSKTSNPTIALSTKTTDGSGTGVFTSSISGLSANTSYFVRAYATNSAGTAYGNEVNFTTQNVNYSTLYPSGTVFCNNVVTAVVDVTNPTTGKTWMDRNLGASQVATSSTDALAYGDLYQWGRRADGHQCRNSATTTTLSSTDQPNHGNFIINPNMWSGGTADWHSPHNPNLWQGLNGVNNPCPVGYRIPTNTEWDIEIQSWSTKNTIGAFNSSLKLPLAAIRFSNDALIGNLDYGFYYSSTSINSSIKAVLINSINAQIPGYTGMPAGGLSVRCIKN